MGGAIGIRAKGRAEFRSWNDDGGLRDDWALWGFLINGIGGGFSFCWAKIHCRNIVDGSLISLFLAGTNLE